MTPFICCNGAMRVRFSVSEMGGRVTTALSLSLSLEQHCFLGVVEKRHTHKTCPILRRCTQIHTHVNKTRAHTHTPCLASLFACCLASSCCDLNLFCLESQCPLGYRCSSREHKNNVCVCVCGVAGEERVGLAGLAEEAGKMTEDGSEWRKGCMGGGRASPHIRGEKIQNTHTQAFCLLPNRLIDRTSFV